MTEHLDQPLDTASLAPTGSNDLDDLGAYLDAHDAGALHDAKAETAVAALALSLPPVLPGGSLRARLFASVDHVERFTPMAPRLAALIDISANEARQALHALSGRPEALPATRWPGMRAVPLAPGPRRATTGCLLACLEPGSGLTRHRHIGEEHVLVFQGAFATDDDRIVRAGEELYSPAGSTHSIPRVLGDEPCLCAIVVDHGIEVLP